MVSGMSKITMDHDGVCQGCTSGKHVEGPFPSNKSKTSEVLHLIHSDLSRPITLTSLGGYLYYIIFVDDFSHKTWTFFLKNRSQAFNMFKDFKALVEKQPGKQIKIFKSENDKQFTSNDFIDFYKEVGIRKETIILYNPEQNGVAERKNRTIMEVVKAMLHDQKLPKFLWGGVANTVIYVQNRSPHRALNKKTP